MTRAIIVTGAGGVGKTTISAGLAVAAASRKMRALVLTVDPARRLAGALGLEDLGNEPTEVTALPGLDAAMLDAAASWEAIIDRHAPADAAARLHDNPFFRAIADRFPATQSYAAGEQMSAYIESRFWDIVIIDTPPAGGGIEFYSAPRRMRDLVGGKLLRWLTGAGLPGRRTLYRITARPVLRFTDTILGGQLLEQVAEFLLDLRTIYDGLSARAHTVEGHLAEAETVVVTTTDPTPIREAHRFFTDESVPTPTRLVFNRTLPSDWAHRHPVPDGPDEETRRILRDNLERWGTEVRRQADARSEFAGQFGARIVTVPWLAEAPTDLTALGTMIESAEGWDLDGLLQGPEPGRQPAIDP